MIGKMYTRIGSAFSFPPRCTSYVIYRRLDVDTFLPIALCWFSFVLIPSSENTLTASCRTPYPYSFPLYRSLYNHICMCMFDLYLKLRTDGTSLAPFSFFPFFLRSSGTFEHLAQAFPAQRDQFSDLEDALAAAVKIHQQRAKGLVSKDRPAAAKEVKR